MSPLGERALARLRQAYESRGGDWEELRAGSARAREFLAHNQNLLCFAGGFLFDSLTLNRIDAWLDLATQAAYLVGLTTLIVLLRRQESGSWRPPERLAPWWAYSEELLHFLIGGLLSAYYIFYTKSGSAAQGGLFVCALLALLVFNERPEARRWDWGFRLALHAFCAVSFLVYLVPVLAGTMGDRIFTLSWALAAALSAGVVGLCAREELDLRAALRRLAPAPAAVLLAIAGLYFLRWMPPVPLSLQYLGIYHGVERAGAGFRLSYEKRPWAFLRSEDRPYYARAGDRLYCFARVFAPRGFKHKVALHWLLKDAKGAWVSRDRIELPILGGREAGFRGYAYKLNYEPGDWLLRVETEDHRVVGQTQFRVLADDRPDPRRWATRKM